MDVVAQSFWNLDGRVMNCQLEPLAAGRLGSQMRFDVSGPFEINRYGPKQIITADSLKSLKEAADNWEVGLSSACGCYVFAVRAGKGYTPHYVGQSCKRSILAEALNPRNQTIYNKVLGETGKGVPVLFLIPMRTPGGKFRKPIEPRSKRRSFLSVDFLEEWFIAEALRKNPLLCNNRKTKFLRQVHVVGVFNAKKGEATKASTQLSKTIWR